ncbi:diaminopimelate epimerase [Salinisphaera sp. USBA-960]|uniref:diaminopimelate epimerase n=1 Tax=Salinisphaera orenii TaxID=856731 RepID=UPI000DBE791E|nr:diaminopimelate epimerase [Salifodinibacter halophilus]NNC25348.1 diaminopimelate epimerase [Salifodinibacter halophilus]
MLDFAKMHGLGNDFVVFDAVTNPITLDAERAAFIADRHVGIGCDQILLVEPTEHVDADFGYRIINADGSESEQCGNGARCLARFIAERGLHQAGVTRLATRNGRIDVETLGDNQYRAALGVPNFEPANIGLNGFNAATQYRLDDVATQTVVFDAVAVGNPHAIIDVGDINRADVAGLGPALENHPAFEHRVNADFCETVARNHIKLRVFERGAGQTLACGSAAAAAVVSGIRRSRLDDNVTAKLPGGQVTVDWSGPGHPVYLSGPASHVFDGTINLE